MPIFEGTGDAIGEINEDLKAGFGEVFETIEDARAVGVFADRSIGDGADTGNQVSVVAWEWQVRHMGYLNYLAPTGKEVTMRGVTVVDESTGERLYSRYIDWLQLYAELGAVAMVRPPVDD